MAQIEIETSRTLLHTTLRRTWYAVSGFAPYVYKGRSSRVLHRHHVRRPSRRSGRDWRDEGGEG